MFKQRSKQPESNRNFARALPVVGDITSVLGFLRVDIAVATSFILGLTTPVGTAVQRVPNDVELHEICVAIAIKLAPTTGRGGADGIQKLILDCKTAALPLRK